MFTLLRSLSTHRKLIKEFVVRDLKARYVGSSMGFFWSVVVPILNLGVYMFVFRLVLNVRWGDDASEGRTALVMLTGILVWSAFAETLSRATNSLVENANMIQKVVFPSEILAPYLTLSSLVNMAIGIPVVVIGTVVQGPSTETCKLNFAFQPENLSLCLLALPVLMALQAVFTAGLGYLLSALNLFVRDIFHIIGVFTVVWMFATPIFYPDFMVDPDIWLATFSAPVEADFASAEEFADATAQFYARMPKMDFGWMLALNPMYWLIECYRDILMYQQWPELRFLLRYLAVALALFWLGSSFFRRHKPTFPDLL